ncbi:MAG: hypothetical protein COW08_08235 [Ignavibacteriales bacterium CG12_big_fil_rev_8_21_14_0_65_30_8]|nr:MAG: hypothetical protein COW08_08235 [Ignavibacteriales bacterium CG12_big_fil_rev_8_21_14_0_65_30_8]
MNEILSEIKNIKETKKDLKKFGLSVGIVLFLISVLLYWFEQSSYLIFGIIGLSLIILALVFPKILKPLNKIWMSIAVILGWFMSRVILIILFYIILTPIGIILKIFRKKFLNLKIDKSTDTYWEYRKNEKISKSNLENQF